MDRETKLLVAGLGAVALYLMTRRAESPAAAAAVIDTRQDTSSLGPIEPIGGPILPGANPDNAVTYAPPLGTTPNAPRPPLPAGWTETILDTGYTVSVPTVEHKTGCDAWPLNTFNPECEGVTWVAVRAANIPYMPDQTQDWMVRILEAGLAKGPLTEAERRNYLLDPSITDWYLFDTRHP